MDCVVGFKVLEFMVQAFWVWDVGFCACGFWVSHVCRWQKLHSKMQALMQTRNDKTLSWEDAL